LNLLTLRESEVVGKERRVVGHDDFGFQTTKRWLERKVAVLGRDGI
jgi:hypothetical protein